MAKFLSYFGFLRPKKWPKFSQWKRITKVLHKKERNALLAFLFLFIVSAAFLSISLYLENTEIKPANGGSYTEGAIGRPRFINPVYAYSNDADRDLVELLFSGLMRYDGEGKLVPDLAQSYEIKEAGKVYEFTLKNNTTWHDGKRLSADDIIYTINTIQNPDYKSPLRLNWIGVEVERMSENSVQFTLKNPYPTFLENTTLKILPKHIWQGIPPQNFPLADFNYHPVGSGPYKFKDMIRDQLGYIKSVKIVAFPKYFSNRPFIPEITFNYYQNEEELTKAAKSGNIDGFALLSLKDYKSLNQGSFQEYSLSLPRYFALFLNPLESKFLGDKNIRLALNYGTNKQEFVDKILLGKGKVVDSPILPEIFEFKDPTKIYAFDPEQAKSILEKAGFKDTDADGFREKVVENPPSQQPFKSDLQQGSSGNEVKELQKCLSKFPDIYPEGEVTGGYGEKTKAAVIRFQEKYRQEILDPGGYKQGTGTVRKNTRDKLNELCGKPAKETIPLQFSITTVDQQQLVETANLIKEQWKNIGAKVDVKTFEISKLQQEIIKPRSYEILLFGEVLGAIPDPFSFWHSSQKKDPGLNLVNYENKNADKLLEGARELVDIAAKSENYEKFQDILINDAPAVFLYNPDYVYLISKKIKGVDTKLIVDPSKRFENILNWFIDTKRSWK